MLIVDAQVHIWKTGLPTNPSHRQITSYQMENLLKEMDEGGVSAAVIHPPGWDPNASEVAVEAALKHPNRLSVLGNLPLDQDESHSLVAGWRDRPGMLGFRFTFQQPHQQSWISDGTMEWLWAAAADRWSRQDCCSNPSRGAPLWCRFSKSRWLAWPCNARLHG